MKNNNTFNTLSNQSILAELGFTQAAENIFVRVKNTGGNFRVLFAPFGNENIVRVESYAGGNRRSNIWNCENFILALELLGKLGVK